MASVSAVRDGLKTRLQNITGLNVYDTVPGAITTPAAVVAPGDPVVEFDDTMGRGSDEMNFVVLVLVQDAVDETAQDALDGYLAGSGATSIKAVIEGDMTLGAVVSYARVASARNYGIQAYANVQYLGVEFLIEVTT